VKLAACQKQNRKLVWINFFHIIYNIEEGKIQHILHGVQFTVRLVAAAEMAFFLYSPASVANLKINWIAFIYKQTNIVPFFMST
jgi:hypothetical protein